MSPGVLLIQLVLPVVFLLCGAVLCEVQHEHHHDPSDVATVLLYTYGKCGSTSLMDSFNTWRETDVEMATWPGDATATKYMNKYRFLTEDELACKLPLVILTHNYLVAQHVLKCNMENNLFWVVSAGRSLEQVYVSTFYEKHYFDRPELARTNTTRKAMWFLDHIKPQLASYTPRSELDVEIKRNSRKCHFFSDLASLVAPSYVPQLHQKPSSFFTYDVEKRHGLVRRGERGALANVLLLRFDDIATWGTTISQLLPGWHQFYLTENQFPTTHFSKKLFQSIVKPALLPETNRNMRQCDTYEVFYTMRSASWRD
jgi:hypothetical protein